MRLVSIAYDRLPSVLISPIVKNQTSKLQWFQSFQYSLEGYPTLNIDYESSAQVSWHPHVDKSGICEVTHHLDMIRQVS